MTSRLMRQALILAWLVVAMTAGCQRGSSPSVVIAPRPQTMLPDVPADPFGTPGAAYDSLRQLTDTARTTPWDGRAESLADWIEAQTVAVEESLALLAQLRLGAQDVFAVANGRVALVYEHIASTMTDAEAVVDDSGLEFDWLGQEALLWEQANVFWARCARRCSVGGPYLDVWELRCEAGEKETAARIEPQLAEKSARQPE